MNRIDLNADIGEGGLHDAELIALVSSVNIACGGHSGNMDTMRVAVTTAQAHGVAIGAHPGYEDPQYFGRRYLQVTPDEVNSIMTRQIHNLLDICEFIHHVKPHGALYHQANHDPSLAAAVADAVNKTAPQSLLYVPAFGQLTIAGKAIGLKICEEGFIDRRYQQSGELVPRTEPNAIIDNPTEAANQALSIASKQRVEHIDNGWISLPAQTLCIHGDHFYAVELLAMVRKTLENSGFQCLPG